MVTRVQFAQGLLELLGIQPTNQAVNNLVSWMQAEGGSAAYNPLNTTLNLGLAGETNYNSSGVQNYPSLQIGEFATAETLQNYPKILKALNSPPATFDHIVDSSTWGTHDLTPAVKPINKTVASKPGGKVTPVKSVGVRANESLKPVEWWNPFSWGNAATDAEDIIFRVIAGGVGLFFVVWGIKILFDSKGPSITNIFGRLSNESNQKNSMTSDGEKATEASPLESSMTSVADVGEKAVEAVALE